MLGCQAEVVRNGRRIWVEEKSADQWMRQDVEQILRGQEDCSPTAGKDEDSWDPGTRGPKNQVMSNTWTNHVLSLGKYYS